MSCKHREAIQTDCLIPLITRVESSNQSVWLECVYSIFLLTRDRESVVFTLLTFQPVPDPDSTPVLHSCSAVAVREGPIVKFCL